MEISIWFKRPTILLYAVTLMVFQFLPLPGFSTAALAQSIPSLFRDNAENFKTTTPIKHLVVIIQENETFDHYFGTYPNAQNNPGENKFIPKRGTPAVNGLMGSLLTANPNGVNPFRLNPTQQILCYENNGYTSEQVSYDGGKMDNFVLGDGETPNVPGCDYGHGLGLIMSYYDGNTVTALWNYAQNFAMSDNFYGTTFGPSTTGHQNIVSGQTYAAIPYYSLYPLVSLTAPVAIADLAAELEYEFWVPAIADFGNTFLNDDVLQPDVCNDFYLPYYQATLPSAISSIPSALFQAVIAYYPNLFATLHEGGGNASGNSGKSIGDLLNAMNISWGYFVGGFNLTSTNLFNQPISQWDPTAVGTGCARSHYQSVGSINATEASLVNLQQDYGISPDEPFQYFLSTANPNHTRPTSVFTVGQNDPANHQYDINDFFAAALVGNMPAVTFLKPPIYETGHSYASDPLDEQEFLVNTINFLQILPQWHDTAVIVIWDDSNGWYDHQEGPIVKASESPFDYLNGPGVCNSANGSPPAPLAAGIRCGYGPREPILIISPYAKDNYVSHTLADQSSVIRFIEDNWNLGRIDAGQPVNVNNSYDAIAGSLMNMFSFNQPQYRYLFLNPKTGEPLF